MLRLISCLILSLSALFLTGCADLGSTPATGEEARELNGVVEAFQHGLTTHQGRQVIPLLTSPTMAIHDRVRIAAIQSSPEQMKRFPRIFRTMVWMCRHYYGRERLMSMTAADVFTGFVERGVYGPLVADMRAGMKPNLVIEARPATYEYYRVGGAVFTVKDPGTFRQALARFSKKGGEIKLVKMGNQWKVAFEELLAMWEINMMFQRFTTGMSEKDFVRSWLTKSTGRAPAEDVFRD